MHTYDLCCLGHITLDKIVTPSRTVHMAGGTAFYFSHAMSHINAIDYVLLTSLATTEMQAAEDIRAKQIDVHVMESRNTLYFENKYGENQDNRTQRVLAKADPFTVDFVKDIDAKIFHLGALLADDFSLEVIKFLSGKGILSVDSQGYLREVRGENVFATDWADKMEALKYIDILKVNEHELEALTGMTDIVAGAQLLYDWGVKEVVVTLGSMGSVIYDGTTYYRIPAYKARELVDATGCGDTYMAGYLHQRAQNIPIEQAACFASAMSTLKIEHSGAFSKTQADILETISKAEKQYPSI